MSPPVQWHFHHRGVRVAFFTAKCTRFQIFRMADFAMKINLMASSGVPLFSQIHPLHEEIHYIKLYGRIMDIYLTYYKVYDFIMFFNVAELLCALQ